MNCPYCGAENSESSKYCSLCLKTFQTPAEIELAQEVRHKKEETINKKPKFKPFKFVVIMLVILGLSSVAYLGIKAARKSVGTDLTALTGVSTSKKGVKVKKIIGDKSVEAYMGSKPEGWPNFPIIKGAKIKMGQRIIQGSDFTYAIMASTESNAQEITKFYTDWLSNNKWNINSPGGDGAEGNSLLTFSRFNVDGKILVSDSDITISLTIKP